RSIGTVDDRVVLPPPVHHRLRVLGHLVAHQGQEHHRIGDVGGIVHHRARINHGGESLGERVHIGIGHALDLDLPVQIAVAHAARYAVLQPGGDVYVTAAHRR